MYDLWWCKYTTKLRLDIVELMEVLILKKEKKEEEDENLNSEKPASS